MIIKVNVNYRSAKHLLTYYSLLSVYMVNEMNVLFVFSFYTNHHNSSSHPRETSIKTTEAVTRRCSVKKMF